MNNHSFCVRRLGIAATAGLLIVLSACSTTSSASEDRNADSLTVYATTGYLADAVANIAPEAQVTTMVGPGGDPHTYQASTKDIEAIQSADVVLWNGLHLEAQMLDLLEGLGDAQLAVGEQVPDEMLLEWPETDDEGNALHDPHIWNSTEIWSMVVDSIAQKLGEVDPEEASDYQANAAAFKEEITAARTEAENVLSTIPAGPRILITGHDAFNYFGESFDLDVYATDFVSSEAALSPQELSELASLIADNKVPAIFKDNPANPQAVTSLQQAVKAVDWDVQVSAEELFADSLGPEAPVDTYLGVFAHNARIVADALGESG